MADLHRLLSEGLEGGLLALPTRGKRPCVKSFSLPKGAKRGSPDRMRVVTRYSGEKRPFTAEELIAHIRLFPDHGVSLFPDTMQAVVMDFDEGQGHALWASLIGGYRTHTVSSGGRGLHVWWGRPDGYQAKSGKYRIILPTLDMQGDGKPVEADLIIRGQGVTVTNEDDLESVLAPCWPGLGAITEDEVPPMDADILDTLIGMQEKGVISEAMMAIAKAPPHNRHNVLISEVGKCFQGPFRRFGPDSFLGRALAEVFNVRFGEGKGDEALRVIGDVCAGRQEEHDEASRHFQDRRSGAVEPTGDRPSFAPTAAGLASLVDIEGVKFGTITRGRERLMVDFGPKGKSWEPLTKIKRNQFRGALSRKYAMETKDGQKDWNMSLDKFDNCIADIARKMRIDPFQEYLDSIPKIGYDALFMYGAPFQIWEFEQDMELVGWTFQAMMCAMVARQRWPGCKFDLVPILRGDQGVGKSTFLRALFPQGMKYEDLLGKCNFRLLEGHGGERRLIENTMGKVVCEIPELKAVGNLEEVKDFISSQYDEMRMAYDPDTIQVRRTSIFVATTNHYEPLRSDPSGNRRFVPLSITGLTGGVQKDQAYKHIMATMDRIRDEWWAMAHAAVHDCGDADECGSRLLTPGEDMMMRLTVNAGHYERTSLLGDQVREMVDGLTLADTIGSSYQDREYILNLLTMDTILDHLGLRDGDRRVSNADGGLVKTAMEACGWKSGRVRYGLLDGSQVRRLCFWPAHTKLPSSPVLDTDWTEKCLELAKGGEPITNGQIEALLKESSPSSSRDDEVGDLDIPLGNLREA